MADRPIIFSAPMVRALLDGRKTQTRRVLSHKSIDLGIAPRVEVCHPEWIQFLHPKGGPLTCVKWPYAPGDRLWVREAFAINPAVRQPNRAKNVMYRADVPATEPPVSDVLTMDRLMWAGAELCKWKPSIHMPRWASRLTLTVTDVRVQRLRDISREDAIAEGIQRVGGGMLRWENWSGAEGQSGASPQAAYALLWNSLHGPGAWDANPWVVALTFTVQRGNIDQLPGVAG